METNENVTSLLIDDCNVDRSNTLSFRIILMQGVTFVMVSALISLYINKVDRKKLLSMIIKLFIASFLFEHFFLFNLKTLWNFSWLAIGMLSVFCFNSIDTIFLCDGRVFYDIFELWPVWRYYKRHFSYNIPNKYQVKISLLFSQLKIDINFIHCFFFFCVLVYDFTEQWQHV